MKAKNPGKLSGRTFYCDGRNSIGIIVSERVWQNIQLKRRILDALDSHKGGKGDKKAALAHLNGPIFAFSIRQDRYAPPAEPWLVGPTELIQRLRTYILDQGGALVDNTLDMKLFIPFATWTSEKVRISDLNYVTTPDQFKEEFGISIEDLMASNY